MAAAIRIVKHNTPAAERASIGALIADLKKLEPASLKDLCRKASVPEHFTGAKCAEALVNAGWRLAKDSDSAGGHTSTLRSSRTAPLTPSMPSLPDRAPVAVFDTRTGASVGLGDGTSVRIPILGSLDPPGAPGSTSSGLPGSGAPSAGAAGGAGVITSPPGAIGAGSTSPISLAPVIPHDSRALGAGSPSPITVTPVIPHDSRASGTGSPSPFTASASQPGLTASRPPRAPVKHFPVPAGASLAIDPDNVYGNPRVRLYTTLEDDVLRAVDLPCWVAQAYRLSAGEYLHPETAEELEHSAQATIDAYLGSLSRTSPPPPRTPTPERSAPLLSGAPTFPFPWPGAAATTLLDSPLGLSSPPAKVFPPATGLTAILNNLLNVDTTAVNPSTVEGNPGPSGIIPLHWSKYAALRQELWEQPVKGSFLQTLDNIAFINEKERVQILDAIAVYFANITPNSSLTPQQLLPYAHQLLTYVVKIVVRQHKQHQVGIYAPDMAELYANDPELQATLAPLKKLRNTFEAHSSASTITYHLPATVGGSVSGGASAGNKRGAPFPAGSCSIHPTSTTHNNDTCSVQHKKRALSFATTTATTSNGNGAGNNNGSNASGNSGGTSQSAATRR